MKTSIAAVSVALGAATLVAATPAKVIEARATGSSTSSGSLPTVTVKGNAFFAGDNRFYIRGIDYQPGGNSPPTDPLADKDTCTRDIKYFQELGINTIRVYNVDNAASHDECMSALADAGIYVALDVNTPQYSLRRDKPAQSYNSDYLQSIFATVDAFAKYDNTLLFFSGNEVINDDTTTSCAPYVKATTRDLKQYRDSRGYRAIPIGYSAADIDSNRYEMAQYMNCGTDDQRADFTAWNDYSWCSPSSFTQSGWSQKIEKFANYSIPIFLSEYGCNKGVRKFEEVASLYGSDTTSVYSGGLVYEYSQEPSNYGLVDLSGGNVSPRDDFDALKSAYAANKAPTGDGGYKTDGTPSTCPSTSDTWEVTEFQGSDLPAMPDEAVKFMKDGAGKGPGLDGPGSQDAQGTSTGTASAGSGSATVKPSDSASSTSTATGAASSVNQMGATSFTPYIMTGVVALSTLLGAALL